MALIECLHFFLFFVLVPGLPDRLDLSGQGSNFVVGFGPVLEAGLQGIGRPPGVLRETSSPNFELVLVEAKALHPRNPKSPVPHVLCHAASSNKPEEPRK